jgi:hypothetical protein
VGEFFTTDSDAGDTFTYALAVADGTLTAAAVAGITVGGSDTARTIAGTPAALNAYFKTAGRIKYTTATNNTVARTLTTTVSDGTLSDSKTSTISITPVDDAPTIWVWSAFGFRNTFLSTRSVIRISEEPFGGRKEKGARHQIWARCSSSGLVHEPGVGLRPTAWPHRGVAAEPVGTLRHRTFGDCHLFCG